MPALSWDCSKSCNRILPEFLEILQEPPGALHPPCATTCPDSNTFYSPVKTLRKQQCRVWDRTQHLIPCCTPSLALQGTVVSRMSSLVLTLWVTFASPELSEQDHRSCTQQGEREDQSSILPSSLPSMLSHPASAAPSSISQATLSQLPLVGHSRALKDFP